MATTLTNGLVLPDPGDSPAIWRPIVEDNFTTIDDALGELATHGDAFAKDIGTGAGDIAAGDAPLTAANAAIAAHVAASDPHTQYLTESAAAATYAPITSLEATFARRVSLQPTLLASISNVGYPLVVDATILASNVLVKVGTVNDGSNYWEAHLSTADVELATWNTIALTDDAWTLVTTTTFSKVDLTALTDVLLTLWFTPIGTPSELLYQAPIMSLV